MQENSARSQLGEFLELKTSTALASGCDGNYEKHLLNLFSIFSCQLYNSLRSKFFADVNERYPIFNDLGLVHTSHFCRVECNSNKR